MKVIDPYAIGRVLDGDASPLSLSPEEFAAYRLEVGRRIASAAPAPRFDFRLVHDLFATPSGDEVRVPCYGDRRFTEYPVPAGLEDTCKPCALKGECREAVRPVESCADGIVAGVVYCNGRPVAR